MDRAYRRVRLARARWVHRQNESVDKRRQLGFFNKEKKKEKETIKKEIAKTPTFHPLG